MGGCQTESYLYCWNAALVVALWWLLSTREQISVPNLLRLVRLWPDVGFVLILVTVLGVDWRLLGTIWTVRLLRRGTRAQV